MKLVFCLFVLSTSVTAQVRTPREIVNLTLERIPELKAEAHTVSAAIHTLKQSKLLQNPILTFQGGELRSGDSRGGVADITLNQPIPWPGRRSGRIKVSEGEVKLSELTFEQSKIQVANRLYVLCAEIAALEGLEVHFVERKKRFGLIHRFLTSRPTASPKQVIERSLIETQIKLVEKSMIELTARKEVLIKEVEIWSGVGVTSIAFDWQELPALPRISDFMNNLDGTLSFKKMRVAEQVSEQHVANARLDARPDIILGVNYRRENVVPSNDFYHAQVSVVIPLIDHGQYSVETAKANQRRIEAENRMAANTIQRDILQSYLEMEAAHKSSQLFPIKKLQEHERNFVNAETAFRKGQIEAMLFLQIDSLVHDTFEQIYRSRLTFFTSLAELNKLVGKAPEL